MGNKNQVYLITNTYIDDGEQASQIVARNGLIQAHAAAMEFLAEHSEKFEGRYEIGSNEQLAEQWRDVWRLAKRGKYAKAIELFNKIDEARQIWIEKQTSSSMTAATLKKRVKLSANFALCNMFDGVCPHCLKKYTEVVKYEEGLVECYDCGKLIKL